MEDLISEVAKGLLKILRIRQKHPTDAPYKTEDWHLGWMLIEIVEKKVLGTKAHRWLGFVQGIMVMRGYISVDEERDRTRPYFSRTDAF